MRRGGGRGGAIVKVARFDQPPGVNDLHQLMTGRCLQNLLVGVTSVRTGGGRKFDKNGMREAT